MNKWHACQGSYTTQSVSSDVTMDQDFRGHVNRQVYNRFDKGSGFQEACQEASISTELTRDLDLQRGAKRGGTHAQIILWEIITGRYDN